MSLVKKFVSDLRLIGDWWAITSGAASIPFAILSAFNFGSQRRILAVMAFVTLWIGFYRLANKARPKLRIIKCALTVPTPIVITDSRGGIFTATARYFRIHVKAECIGQVKECQAHLTRIERNGEMLWGDDNAPLTFAPGPREGELTRAISNKLTEFIDVLMVTHDGRLCPGTQNRVWKYPPRQFHEIFSEHGEYTLMIVLTGHDTASVEASLKFSWTGSSDNSQLSVIKAQ